MSAAPLKTFERKKLGGAERASEVIDVDSGEDSPASEEDSSSSEEDRSSSEDSAPDSDDSFQPPAASRKRKKPTQAKQRSGKRNAAAATGTANGKTRKRARSSTPLAKPFSRPEDAEPAQQPAKPRKKSTLGQQAGGRSQLEPAKPQPAREAPGNVPQQGPKQSPYFAKQAAKGPLQPTPPSIDEQPPSSEEVNEIDIDLDGDDSASPAEGPSAQRSPAPPEAGPVNSGAKSREEIGAADEAAAAATPEPLWMREAELPIGQQSSQASEVLLEPPPSQPDQETPPLQPAEGEPEEQAVVLEDTPGSPPRASPPPDAARAAAFKAKLMSNADERGAAKRAAAAAAALPLSPVLSPSPGRGGRGRRGTGRGRGRGRATPSPGRGNSRHNSRMTASSSPEPPLPARPPPGVDAPPDSDMRKALWDPPVSPFNLIEEALYDDPWRLLVACMLLNKTTGRAVRKILWQLFQLAPTPGAAAACDTDAVEAIIRPLGLHRKRALMFRRFSQEYKDMEWTDPQQLHGIGRYAADAYYIFCRNQWRSRGPPADKDLRKYYDWLLQTDGLGSALEREKFQPPSQDTSASSL